MTFAFGTQIRSARIAKGLTQRDVARLLEVTQPSVSAWEDGTATPRPARIKAIARLLGLDAKLLLRDAFLRGLAA